MRVKAILAALMLVFVISGAAFAAEYVGTKSCAMCHGDVAKKVGGSVHGRFGLDVTGNPKLVPGEWDGNWAKTLNFTREDVKFVLLPQAGWLQTAELIGQKGTFGVPADDYPVLWASVELAHNEWVIEGAATGQGTPWLSTCAGCHVTGLKVPTKANPTQARSFVELGLNCENCHGPASEHIKDPMNVKLPALSDATVCGQCHERGASVGKKPNDTTFGYPYSAEGKQFVPGEDLAKYYKTSNPKDNPKDFWPTGHARNSHHMQYPEWLMSKHATSLASLKSNSHATDDCLKCHSTDAITGKATLATAKSSLTCQACHDSHDPTALRLDERELCASCHNAEGSLEPGKAVHHPTAELYSGAQVQGVTAVQSRHAKAGVTCQDCHMPKVTDNAHKGSHLMKAVTPGEGLKNGMPDSCSACHKDAGSFVGGEMAVIQDEITGALKNVKGKLDSLKAKFEKDPSYLEAKLYFDIVDQDGTKGFHNPGYAKALLAAADKKLSALK